MAKLKLNIPDVSLPDGNTIPILGYGTGSIWGKTEAATSTSSKIMEVVKSALESDSELVEAIKTALDQGYRHLDTSEMDNNESDVGKAIKDSGIDRESLFITAKCYSITSNIQERLDESLKNLGLTYVDLYLLQQPFDAQGDKDVIQRAWTQMEAIQASGKAKSIGVSNFDRQALDAVLETAKARPAINQIEFHPYLNDDDFISFHRNKDIRLAGYSVQAPYTRVKDGPLTPLLQQLAKKYAVSPDDILVRWVVDQNIVTITTTSKEQRMSDTLRVATFNLTPKEIDDIAEQGKQFDYRRYWGKFLGSNPGT